jgi:hypothetical protein
MPTVRIGTPPASLRPSAWTDYMAGAKVSSALLLFGLLLLIQWLKGGKQLPDRQRTLGLLLGAFVVVLSASVAPDFVTVLLVALLVVSALNNADAITAAMRRMQELMGVSPAGPGTAPLVNPRFSPPPA